MIFKKLKPIFILLLIGLIIAVNAVTVKRLFFDKKVSAPAKDVIVNSIFSTKPDKIAIHKSGKTVELLPDKDDYDKIMELSIHSLKYVEVFSKSDWQDKKLNDVIPIIEYVYKTPNTFTVTDSYGDLYEIQAKTIYVTVPHYVSEGEYEGYSSDGDIYIVTHDDRYIKLDNMPAKTELIQLVNNIML